MIKSLKNVFVKSSFSKKKTVHVLIVPKEVNTWRGDVSVFLITIYKMEDVSNAKKQKMTPTVAE